MVTRPMTADRLTDVIHILDDARLIVMILDEDGMISFVNDYGRRASGLGAIELIRRPFVDAMIVEGAWQRVQLTQLLRGQHAHFNH